MSTNTETNRPRAYFRSLTATPEKMRAEAFDVLKAITLSNYTLPLTVTLDGFDYEITTAEERAQVVEAYTTGTGYNLQPLTLSDVISSHGHITLTDDQQAAFVATFGAYCRQRTRDALRRMIRYPSTLANYGIYSRVWFTEDGVYYCAGQSYPDEIRTIRELILNR